LATLVAASTTLLIIGRRGLASRFASGGVAISLLCFFIFDQHRLQPWAWQFFLLSVLLALADDVTATRCWIWLTVSIYFWSAVSKFDYNFFHDQGPILVEGLKHAIGLRHAANRWVESFDVGAAIVLAAGEMSVAVLLSFVRTRRIGVWLAVYMHVALLIALGPLGLNHSWGVLLWNAFFAGQTWLLFRSACEPRDSAAGSLTVKRTGSASRWGNRLATGVILGAVLWPVLEPAGGCDHWLAWAVYSARAGQLEILVESDEPLPDGPAEFDQVIRTVNEQSTVYYRAKVAGWSVKELGVPIYPQYRFQVAMGHYLTQRLQLDRVLVINQRRNRWNGQPSELQVIHLQFHDDGNTREQPRVADRFFWNTQSRLFQRD
jgi:hypothetical protein